MTDEVTLKPCPFCGGNAHSWPSDDKENSVSVWCANSVSCAAEVTVPDGEHFDAIEQWNSRPIEDAQQARIRELEAEVERLRGKLDILQDCEADYRSAHDLYGDGHMKAGAAWDAMRRAGDAARQALKVQS